MIPVAVLRVDASPGIGMGHMMRCLALAQGWRGGGGRALFACAAIPDAAEARLSGEGFDVRRLPVAAGSADDAVQTARLAAGIGSDGPAGAVPAWVVADGYRFGADYQRRIRAAGLKLLLLDDYGHGSPHCADLVLNQNPSAAADGYAAREPHVRLLLGAAYTLLREQFLKYRGWQRETRARAGRLLLTFGGGAWDAAMDAAADAARAMDMESRIVGAAGNGREDGAASGGKTRSRTLREATDMPELMAWADLAVSAGGITCLEMAFMGLPAVVVVTADNQAANAAALDRIGACVNLGPLRQATPARLAEAIARLSGDAARRRAMSDAGRGAIDGAGVARAVTWMKALSLELRAVRAEDCRRIWEWANEPATRAASFSPARIPWETHEAWFRDHIGTLSCRFYVAGIGDLPPLGQIRFDIRGDEAIVSTALIPAARGQGYGAALILRGSEQCLADSPVARLRARVKADNAPSIRAFVRAGYTRAADVEVNGCPAVEFVLDRSATEAPGDGRGGR